MPISQLGAIAEHFQPANALVFQPNHELAAYANRELDIDQYAGNYTRMSGDNDPLHVLISSDQRGL